MDNPRKNYCAFIHGDPTDLNRVILKKEFGAYGDIKKIYINEQVTFAKVYLHDQGALKRACADLDNRYSWKITLREVRVQDNSTSNNSNSITSELITVDDMDNFSNDEDFVYRDGFVDIHGRDILVLEGAPNDFYVNVKDVRRTGFLILPKEDFNPCLITKEQKLKEFELYLLGHAQSYLLATKSKMSEDEILTTIERVKHKMLGNYDSNQSNTTVQRQNASFDQPQSRRQQLDRSFQPSTRNFGPNQNNTKNQQGGNRRQENDRTNRDSYGGNRRNRDQPDERNNAAGPGSLSRQKSFSDQRTSRGFADNGNINTNYRPTNKSLTRNQAGSSTDGYSRGNKSAPPSNDPDEDWNNETAKAPKMSVQGLDKKLTEHNSNDIARVKLKEGDATVNSEQIPSVKKEQKYIGCPQPLSVLQNDDKVLLIDFNNGCLYVRTKKCCEGLKELNQYIDQLDKKPLQQVEKDQIVLCTKDGLKGLHRAIVLEKDDETAKVKYLDYVGEERLSLRSLRDVDDRIATEPLMLIECPKSKEVTDASAKSLQLMDEMIEGKRKLVVKIEKDNVDLTYEGTSLFNTIRELNKSEETKAQKTEPVKLTESPAELKNDIVKPVPVKVNSKEADAKISYDDMQFVDVKEGKAEYMCYSLKGKEVTLLGTTEQDTKYLETLLCYEVKDNTPYEPEEYEMCLTMFDNTWSRAVPTFVDKEKGEYEMLFVDFGNIEVMKKGDIRKLPHELKDIPILAIQGQFSGLPDDKKVLDKLAELITDGSTFEVNIKGDRDSDTLTCPIEIPTIYEELRKLSLI